MNGEYKPSQRKKVAVKAVLTRQDEEQSRRFYAATDLLLADIVRRVMDGRIEGTHGKQAPTR